MQSTVSEISTVFLCRQGIIIQQSMLQLATPIVIFVALFGGDIMLFGGDMQCFRPPSATLAVLVNDLSDYVCVRLQSHDLVMW